jgi:cobalt-zinc-cadmium efflux system membrane fusion protein
MRTPHSSLPLFFLLALVIAGCGSRPVPANQTSASSSSGDNSASSGFQLPEDARGVRMTTVALRHIFDYIEVSARIQPDPTRVVRVFSPVGGRLVSVDVKPGDHIRKGQVIAELQSSDIAALRSEHAKARADADAKRKVLARAELLYQNEALSQKEYQQAQADAQMAEAEQRRTEAALHVLGISPEGTSNGFTVVAPRDGVVLDIGAAPGEFSKSLEASAPVCTLADLSHVWAVGELYERDVAASRVGAETEVRVASYPERKWKARVVALSGALDAATRTLKLRVELPNPDGKLKPEMFASIRIFRSAKEGLVIPADAVLREGSSAYVFVQKSGRSFEKRVITVGESRDGEVEVTAGLKQGEVIVTEGALLLRGPAS